MTIVTMCGKRGVKTDQNKINTWSLSLLLVSIFISSLHIGFFWNTVLTPVSLNQQTCGKIIAKDLNEFFHYIY